MFEIFEKITDLRLTRNIWWETTRYHSWYATILNKIRNSLARQHISDGSFSFREQYNHPSAFIQQLAEWDLIGEEKSIDGFLEWLKEKERKNMVKKLIIILSKIIKI